jgi:antirestriction protein ArdC
MGLTWNAAHFTSRFSVLKYGPKAIFKAVAQAQKATAFQLCYLN